MQNIVIDKPYRFIPPFRGTFWPHVFKPLVRPYLKRSFGIERLEIRDLDRLRALISEGASIVLAPNHCRPSDPMVVGAVSAAAGTPCYIMASWHLFMQDRFTSWLLPRLGAFSVYREGLDRAAIKEAVDLLASASRPLVIFPEGIVTRSNDRLAVFNEGPAFIARSAAKQRKKEGGGRTVIVPIALRYWFGGDLLRSIGPVLDAVETRLTWKPKRSVPVEERLRAIGEALVSLKELELTGSLVQGDLAERMSRLIAAVLTPLEAQYGVKVKDPDVPTRVRALRSAILPDMIGGELPDAERERRWEQLAQLYFAQQLSLYPSGYLTESATQERTLETVERLEEDLTDVATIHRPMLAIAAVGEPIDMTDADQSPAEVMKDVRQRIGLMLDELRASGAPTRA